MTLDGTRTFVVGRDRPVVIDPGPDDPVHLRATLDALEGSTPLAILLTHRHPDHADGAEALGRATGAPVRAADAGSGHGIGEGEVIPTDEGTLDAIATPGHTPDHLCFRWRDEEGRNVLFVGDLLMGEGDTTLVAHPEGDLGAYLQSLRRVAALAPDVLFPSHGPPIHEPGEAVRRYLRHRVERVEGTRAALRRIGPAGLPELLDAVYGDTVPPALRGAAAASLRAVLDHLERLGSVRRLPDARFAIV
jgi:glyoxylase-like metal-dependent hydrolase (beta-lactamase superfamily II)